MCFAWEPIKHVRKTNVLCGNLRKTDRKHRCCARTYREFKRKRRCCVGTNGKRKENIGFAWEPIRTSGKHWLCVCVETNGKRKENKGVAWEWIENARKL